VGNEVNLGLRRVIDISQEFHASFTHHHDARREPNQVAHHAALLFVRFAQHRVQGGDDGHSQFAQQCQHMTSRRPAENAELMLHANDIHARDVQKVCRAQVGGYVLLGNLKAHFCGVVVAARDVVDRDDQALHLREFLRDGAAQIRGERRNAAFPRQIVAQKCNFADFR
jgi:hypothetical protein